MMYKYPLARPMITKEDEQAVLAVLRSGVLSMGEYQRRFESAFADLTKTRYAAAVSSGTAGLHLSVKALGIGPHDEVITSPFSFISSTTSILFENATPRFVDVEEETFNLDPAKIESAVTTRTKALLVVHIFGQTAEMDTILRVCKTYSLALIEDACESVGATYRGRPAGSFGEAAVFAFYPNKQLVTGEGGMVTTNSKQLHSLILTLRNQGRRPNETEMKHAVLGYNYRLDEMSAALGYSQLQRITSMLTQREQIARWYGDALQAVPNVRIPQVGAHRRHSWFVYVIRVPATRRKRIIEELGSVGVQARPYLPVIHLQPFMRQKFGYKKGDFPIAEQIASETIALPFYLGLKKDDVTSIVRLLKRLL